MSGSDAVDVVRAYHSATTHGGDHDRSRRIDFTPLDPTNQPAPFKLYPDYPYSPLAEDLLVTAPIEYQGPFDLITCSGGVGEYIMGTETWDRCWGPPFGEG